MDSFEQELRHRLQILEKENLRRHLRRVNSPQGARCEIAGRAVLNFSSNDYLGLATQPALKEAAAKAIRDFGTGSGASRLICGSLSAHDELEEALAEFKGTEAALVFSSGYATALGTITALVGKGDVVVLDKLVHASIVDAARLSGAALRVYAHNDLNNLAEILQWCDRQQRGTSPSRVLIVTESLFSMDGDFAPLPDIVGLKQKHGAWLMVDEAHATGLFGEGRRGLVEESGVSGEVEVQMGTLGKALGTAGGFIAGKLALRDYLVNKARSFIFSTAPPPAISASANAALKLIKGDEGQSLLVKLRSNVERFLDLMKLSATAKSSPIVPLIVGQEHAALDLAARLFDQGMFVPAIRYPTVARGKARLRITFSAAHDSAEVGRLAGALNQAR